MRKKSSALAALSSAAAMDGRVKPGHDEQEARARLGLGEGR
jgi:hypothetical protein